MGLHVTVRNKSGLPLALTTDIASANSCCMCRGPPENDDGNIFFFPTEFASKLVSVAIASVRP